MNKIIKIKYTFVFFALLISTQAVFAVYTAQFNPFPLTAEDMGATNYQDALQNAYRNTQSAYETAYANQMMAENLRRQQLQNRILQAQWETYLASHPKIAKDIKEKEEFQRLMSRNSGLFSSYTAYIKDLKNCSSHGNKYCKAKLSTELMRCKKKGRC